MAVQKFWDTKEKYIGLSGDSKPTRNLTPGDKFFESDTGNVFFWCNHEWVLDQEFSRSHVWNPETLAWEAMAQNQITLEGDVVVSGVSVANWPADDPTNSYKITDIDPTDGNSYFGYVDKDGKWYIMNLTASAARYFKGDTGYLAAWAGKGDLDYDYFHNIF